MLSYGSSLYRTSYSLSDVLAFSHDGRTLLVGRTGPNEVLDAVNLGTGAVTRGPLVGGLVPVGGGRVVAVEGGSRSRLLVLGDRDLDLVATVPLPAGVTVTGLATAADTVVAIAEGTDCALIVDLTTSAVRQVLLPARPTCVALSADALVTTVGTGSGRSGSVVVIDTVAGVVRTQLRGLRAHVGSIAVAADGSLVAAAAGRKVMAWPLVRDGAPLAKPAATTVFEAENASVIGIVPDGPCLVAGRAGKAPLAAVDPSTGEVLWSLPQNGPSLLHGGRLVSTHFREVREIDPTTGVIKAGWTSPGFARALGVSEEAITVLDLGARPRLLREPGRWPGSGGSGHESPVRYVHFDEGRFATAARDRLACVWARGRTEPIVTVEAPFERYSADSSHVVRLSGPFMYTGFNWRVQRWSLADGACLAESDRFRFAATALVPVPEAGLLVVCTEARATCHGDIGLVDLATLEVRQTRKIDVQVTDGTVVGPGLVELAADHERLMFDLVKAKIVQRDRLRTDDYLRQQHHTADRTLQVETRTYVARDDREAYAQVWAVDSRTGRRMYEHRIAPMTHKSALSPAGVLATPQHDALRLWDAATWTLVGELPPLPPEHLSYLSFFPDGSGLLLAGYDGSLTEIETPHA